MKIDEKVGVNDGGKLWPLCVGIIPHLMKKQLQFDKTHFYIPIVMLNEEEFAQNCKHVTVSPYDFHVFSSGKNLSDLCMAFLPENQTMHSGFNWF